MTEKTYDFGRVWLARQIQYQIHGAVSTKLSPGKKVIIQLALWSALDGEQKKQLIALAKDEGVRLETPL